MSWGSHHDRAIQVCTCEMAEANQGTQVRPTRLGTRVWIQPKLPGWSDQPADPCAAPLPPPTGCPLPSAAYHAWAVRGLDPYSLSQCMSLCWLSLLQRCRCCTFVRFLGWQKGFALAQRALQSSVNFPESAITHSGTYF